MYISYEKYRLYWSATWQVKPFLSFRMEDDMGNSPKNGTFPDAQHHRNSVDHQKWPLRLQEAKKSPWAIV